MPAKNATKVGGFVAAGLAAAGIGVIVTHPELVNTSQNPNHTVARFTDGRQHKVTLSVVWKGGKPRRVSLTTPDHGRQVIQGGSLPGMSSGSANWSFDYRDGEYYAVHPLSENGSSAECLISIDSTTVDHDASQGAKMADCYINGPRKGKSTE